MLRDEIFSKWDAIQKELRGGYRKQATQAYERLLKLDPELLQSERGTISAAEFVRRYLARVESVIPDRETVRQSFAYETALSYIPLPSLLAEDLAHKEQVDADREKIEYKKVLTREKASLEMRKVQEQQRLLDQMNRDVVREAQVQKERLVNDFLVDVEAQLLSSMYDGLANVLDSMDKNGGLLVGKAAEQIRGTLQLAETLNFTGNAEVKQQIEQIRNVMEVPAKERNAAQVQALLTRITDSQRKAMKEMGYTPRARRNVGVVEDVEVMDVGRRGRRL